MATSGYVPSSHVTDHGHTDDEANKGQNNPRVSICRGSSSSLIIC